MSCNCNFYSIVVQEIPLRHTACFTFFALFCLRWRLITRLFQGDSLPGLPSYLGANSLFPFPFLPTVLPFCPSLFLSPFLFLLFLFPYLFLSSLRSRAFLIQLGSAIIHQTLHFLTEMIYRSLKGSFSAVFSSSWPRIHCRWLWFYAVLSSSSWWGMG